MNQRWLTGWCLGGLIAAALAVPGLGRGFAADPPAIEPEEQRDLRIWSFFLDGDRRAKSLFLVARITEPNPFVNAVVAVYGESFAFEWEDVANRVLPPFPSVTDKPGSFIPDKDLLRGVQDRKPILSRRESEDEVRAYCYLLALAANASRADLSRHARRDVSYRQLFNRPQDYRGEIIHIRGTLLRLEETKAPLAVHNDGVRTIYEGWIKQSDSFTDPYCVIVTELPPGLKPAEKLYQEVFFDGYFFKRYRYATKELEERGGKLVQVQREVPLLIGKTFTLPPVAAEEDTVTAISSLFVTSAIVLILSIVGTGMFLSWWFRRGDREVQARVAEARKVEFVIPTGEESEAAPRERSEG